MKQTLIIVLAVALLFSIYLISKPTPQTNDITPIVNQQQELTTEAKTFLTNYYKMYTQKNFNSICLYMKEHCTDEFYADLTNVPEEISMLAEDVDPNFLCNFESTACEIGLDCHKVILYGNTIYSSGVYPFTAIIIINSGGKIMSCDNIQHRQ